MNGKINDNSDKKAIISKFIDKFIKSNYSFFNDNTGARRLLWCSFKENVKRVFKTEELSKIKVPSNNPIYFYSERTEELYKTSFSDICEFVNNLEPWEYIDAEIFDDTMEWVIAITHEDVSIIIGLE